MLSTGAVTIIDDAAVKIYFYTPQKDSCLKLNETKDLIGLSRGLEFWIHQTWFYLKRYSSIIEPIVVNEVPDAGVVVFHKGYFPKNLRPGRSQYFVCVQADYGRHRYAQMHIVQNAEQVRNFFLSKQSAMDRVFSFAYSLFIPHWPQPELIGRDPARSEKLENIGFFGNPEQFPQNELEDVKTILCEAQLNLELKLTPQQWVDYSQTDVSLALRSFRKAPYYNKPFSKILNAVLSDTLVIAGDESANRYFKSRYYPELPIVSSPKELELAIKELQADPQKAFSELKACKNRICELSFPAISKSWETALADAAIRLGKWQKLGSLRRALFIKLRSI